MAIFPLMVEWALAGLAAGIIAANPSLVGEWQSFLKVWANPIKTSLRQIWLRRLSR